MAIATVLDGGAHAGPLPRPPVVQSAELLLQERTPRDVAVARPRAEEVAAPVARPAHWSRPCRGVSHTPHDPTPRTHLLSNGRYSVLFTAAGSGGAAAAQLDVTRWCRGRDARLLGDLPLPARRGAGAFWSAGYQPAGSSPTHYEVAFTRTGPRQPPETARSR